MSSCRFALAAHYSLTLNEKSALLASVPWRAKYLLHDDVIRYVSLENFKYEETGTTSGGNEIVGGHGDVSMLVHTSVPYGLANMEVLRTCTLQDEHDCDDRSGVGGGSGAYSALQEHKEAIIATNLEHASSADALPMLRGRTPTSVRLLGWEESQVRRVVILLFLNLKLKWLRSTCTWFAVMRH